MTEPGAVRFERPAAAVVRLVIHRPDRSNALTAAAASELLAALRAAEADPTVHVVLVTGAGDRAFCGGYDLGAVGRGIRDEELQELLTGLRGLSVPTVAVVAGHAVGAGFDLACSCDLRVVRRGVKVGLPAVRLGVAYAATGLREILHKVPAARRILLTGELVQADELVGFADVLTGAGDVERESLSLAEALASASPAGLAYMLHMVRAHVGDTIDPGVARRWREQVLDSDEPDAAAKARATGAEPGFAPRRVPSALPPLDLLEGSQA